MSGGVLMYGGPSAPVWPVSPPEPQGAPSTDAGRVLDFLGAPKKRAAIAVESANGALRIKVTVDGVLVSECSVEGPSAVLTVAL